MLHVTGFYTEIIYSTLGLIIGLSVSAIVFYSVTYSKVTRKNRQLREACLLYQTQFTQLINKNKALEIQLREARQRPEQKQEALPAEQTASTDAETLDEEQFERTMLWNEERLRWLQESERLRAKLEELRQEKGVLEDSLCLANERWHQEREHLMGASAQLQQQLEQLQHAHTALNVHVDLDTDAQANVVELQNKLNKQQEGWKKARQLLETQLTKLQADKQALETELVTQVHQAEREKQALEDEIELLSERMIRLHYEQQTQQRVAPSSAVS
jgi:chromosome segregation ATPase